MKWSLLKMFSFTCIQTISHTRDAFVLWDGSIVINHLNFKINRKFDIYLKTLMFWVVNDVCNVKQTSKTLLLTIKSKLKKSLYVMVQWELTRQTFVCSKVPNITSFVSRGKNLFCYWSKTWSVETTWFWIDSWANKHDGIYNQTIQIWTEKTQVEHQFQIIVSGMVIICTDMIWVHHQWYGV